MKIYIIWIATISFVCSLFPDHSPSPHSFSLLSPSLSASESLLPSPLPYLSITLYLPLPPLSLPPQPPSFLSLPPPPLLSLSIYLPLSARSFSILTKQRPSFGFQSPATPTTLREMVICLKPDVGLVLQMPYCAPRKGFGAVYQQVPSHCDWLI